MWQWLALESSLLFVCALLPCGRHLVHVGAELELLKEESCVERAAELPWPHMGTLQVVQRGLPATAQVWLISDFFHL